MLYIIYHEKYLNYSFGKTHPFWPERAEQFLQKLGNSDIEYEIIEPEKGRDEDILRVHSEEYLSRVKSLAKEGGNLSIDTPVTKENLEAAYYSVGGTQAALNLALEGENVINILGGLHHAEKNDSSGFCIFNDHAIAIKKLQAANTIKKALILDVDVHAGNGTQDIFYEDDSVLNISLHQDPKFFYPGTGFSEQTGEGAGKGYTVNVPLPVGTGQSAYLDALDSVLPQAHEFDADITIMIFGADTYKDDPLAEFEFKLKTYQEIAQRLKEFNNLAILCAGGYSRAVPDIWNTFLYSLLIKK